MKSIKPPKDLKCFELKSFLREHFEVGTKVGIVISEEREVLIMDFEKIQAEGLMPNMIGVVESEG